MSNFLPEIEGTNSPLINRRSSICFGVNPSAGAAVGVADGAMVEMGLGEVGMEENSHSRAGGRHGALYRAILRSFRKGCQHRMGHEVGIAVWHGGLSMGPNCLVEWSQH